MLLRPCSILLDDLCCEVCLSYFLRFYHCNQIFQRSVQVFVSNPFQSPLKEILIFQFNQHQHRVLVFIKAFFQVFSSPLAGSLYCGHPPNVGIILFFDLLIILFLKFPSENNLYSFFLYFGNIKSWKRHKRSMPFSNKPGVIRRLRCWFGPP